MRVSRRPCTTAWGCRGLNNHAVILRNAVGELVDGKRTLYSRMERNQNATPGGEPQSEAFGTKVERREAAGCSDGGNAIWQRGRGGRGVGGGMEEEREGRAADKIRVEEEAKWHNECRAGGKNTQRSRSGMAIALAPPRGSNYFTDTLHNVLSIADKRSIAEFLIYGVYTMYDRTVYVPVPTGRIGIARASSGSQAGEYGSVRKRGMVASAPTMYTV